MKTIPFCLNTNAQDAVAHFNIQNDGPGILELDVIQGGPVLIYQGREDAPSLHGDLRFFGAGDIDNPDSPSFLIGESGNGPPVRIPIGPGLGEMSVYAESNAGFGVAQQAIGVIRFYSRDDIERWNIRV